MKVATIILNYNDEINTNRLVNIIKDYEFINKIIIVDNCSPDGSYDRLRNLASSKIDVIQSDKNGGHAYGNNFAVRYLTTIDSFDYVAISNPDVDTSEEAYLKCLTFLEENDDVAICAPRMFDMNGRAHMFSGWRHRSLKGDIMDSSLLLTGLIKKPHMERYTVAELSKKVVYVDCVAGSFFIIKYDVFEKVNFFDENTFLYYEEDILAFKVKQLGFKSVILNTCKFTHYESITIDKNISANGKYLSLQKSKYYYHKTYNERASKFKLALLTFFTSFRKIELFFLPIISLLRIDKIYHALFFFIKNFELKMIFKLCIYCITLLCLPFIFISRRMRKRNKNKVRLLYFSLVDWKWIKQRPHFLSFGLSQDTDYHVTYTYQTLYDQYMPKSDYSIKNSIDKYDQFEIKSFKIKPANTKGNIKFNSIVSLLRTSFFNYDVIIFTHPNQIDFFFMKLLTLKRVQVYYEMMDNFVGWEKNVDGYLTKEHRLVHFSKHIIVSSNKLKERLLEKYDILENKCTVIRNGYSEELFLNSAIKEVDLPHPNIVYIGTIDDWFDFENLTDYAVKHPEENIVLIGPIGAAIRDMIDDIQIKNIIFYGPVEHDLVPSYISASDILIMPFILNDIIEYVDPVKVYEYLYFKKPIVASYWNELEQFKEMILFYDPDKKDDFEYIINLAKQYTVDPNENYIELMKVSTWESRVKKYLQVIGEK